MHGYYRALKVSTDASSDDIRLAYAMAKQEVAGPALKRVERAFEVLNDPARRKEYDAEGISKFDPLKSPWTLVAALAVLVGAIALLWIPDIRMRNRRFQAGQTLYGIQTRQEFGTVIRAESAHAFPDGIAAPGYLVRLAGSGEEKWFPAVDLQASAEAR